MVGAWYEGKLVGNCKLEEMTDETNRAGFRAGLMSVHPSVMQKGVAKYLIAAGEEFGRSQGAQFAQMELMMPVSWTNKAYEALKALPRNQGYREVEVVPYAEKGERFAKEAHKLKTEVTFTVMRKELQRAKL